MPDFNASEIAKKVLSREILSTSKLIRMVEEEDPLAAGALEELYPFTGNAHIIGVTGLPGSGKSTIINLLIEFFRMQSKSVGVIAVDPSSPLTSGAILGDRVRMVEHSKDSGVFIKSLATRGHYGGLSRSTLQILNILDAMGKDVILIETVGVGQTEASIMNLAHTTILVLVPEMGDYVQTIKAGVLEIADIYVINKTDKKEPYELLSNIESLIRHGSNDKKNSSWEQKIILSSSLNKSGFEELTVAIEEHRQFFNDQLKDSYLKNRILQEIEDGVFNYFIGFCNKNLKYLIDTEDMAKSIASGKKNPYLLSREIIKKLLLLIRNEK